MNDMNEPCPHENISVTMVMTDGGVVVSSQTVCDDCGAQLS
jgi:hypothetical protein